MARPQNRGWEITSQGEDWFCAGASEVSDSVPGFLRGHSPSLGELGRVGSAPEPSQTLYP